MPPLRHVPASHRQPIPDHLASPDLVAKLGLSRLPFGPIHNVDQADDARGPSPQSAAERRARVQAMAAATSDIYRSEAGVTC